ncbi:MAG: S-methyl-5-thioribose-1-phosphate isomerase [Spirochaetales bacterium]|nr:S-methyl-5-thioribose-1-phosphate isomerase [Spirochaetales bacterium]
MLIQGRQYRTIWLAPDKKHVRVIDQRFLPFKFVVEKIRTVEQMVRAIKEMHVRGAPLIGAAAAYGIYLACAQAEKKRRSDEFIEQSFASLAASRPTAVNLMWALDRQRAQLQKADNPMDKKKRALQVAERIAEDDVERCRAIGHYGLTIIKRISAQNKGRPVQILTHCNAGALGCIDFGTATAPIYQARKQGIALHVWVDETRPRNQGRLTAWELREQGIAHTLVCDNAGGLLMRQGMVDMVIVGADRVAVNGDTANKIGTYLKALAAYDNKIPFYVALPIPTIDRNLANGRDIPLEKRDPEEVLYINGIKRGKMERVQLFGTGSTALNHAFDVTPARLITAFITERGVVKSNKLDALKIE